jgi:hypothetical protein
MTSSFIPPNISWEKIPDYLTKQAPCPPPRSSTGSALRSLSQYFMDAITVTDITDELRQQVMLAIITYITHYLKHLSIPTTATTTSTTTTPQLLQDLIISIHDQLFTLHVWPEVQNACATLCEQYYLEKRPNNERVVAQLIPTILVRALDSNESPTRVYGLREALRLLDLEDESASILKELLLRCFMSPSFWDVQNGRKFLSMILTLAPELTLDAHNTIKSQLPALSKSRNANSKAIIGYVGEVYHAAWKILDKNSSTNNDSILNTSTSTSIDPDLIEYFEKHIIQDYMNLACTLQDSTLIKTIWKILNVAFHSNKNERGIDMMLTRLYEPILWRGLKSPNALIRKNSLCVFVHAFPLQDNTLNVEESSDFFDKQFNMIELALKDTSPDVRVAAVEGACKILSVYWEMMPPKVMSKWLQIMVNDLAFDGTSALVRASVLHGINYMFDEPLTHSVLKIACKHLETLIRDKSPVVRLAMVKLLNKIDNVRGMKYRDIVSIQEVLERLEQDKDDVKLCTGMVELFLHSFYPQGENVDSAEQLRRAKRLAVMQPKAARVFFQHLFHVVSVNKVCKLAMLFASFCRGVKSEEDQQQQQQQQQQLGDDGEEYMAGNNKKIRVKQGENKKDHPSKKTKRIATTTTSSSTTTEHPDNNNEEETENDDIAKYQEIAHLLDACAILWNSIHEVLLLEKNSQALHDMENTFSHDNFIPLMQSWGKIMNIPLARVSIIRLAGFGRFKETKSHPLEVKMYGNIEQMKILSSSTTTTSEYVLPNLDLEVGFDIDCLIAWNRHEALIKHALVSLTATTTSTTTTTTKSNKSSEVMKMMDPHVALFILHRMFSLVKLNEENEPAPNNNNNMMHSILLFNKYGHTIESIIKDGITNASHLSPAQAVIISGLYILCSKVTLIATVQPPTREKDDGKVLTAKQEIDSNPTADNTLIPSPEFDQWIRFVIISLCENPAKRHLQQQQHEAKKQQQQPSNNIKSLLLLSTLHFLGDAVTLGYHILASAAVRDLLSLETMIQNDEWVKAIDRILSRCRSKLNVQDEDNFFHIVKYLFEHGQGIAMISSLLSSRISHVSDLAYENIIVNQQQILHDTELILNPLLGVNEATAKSLAIVASRSLENNNQKYQKESVAILITIANKLKLNLPEVAKILRRWISSNGSIGDLKRAKQASDAADVFMGVV